MQFRTYLTCLWPGLSELWWRGRLSALPLAIGFAIGLNSLLVLKHLYPTWLDPVLVRSAWWVGISVWLFWTIKSVRELPELLNPREAAEVPDRFVEAQTAYLRGDWETAESLLLGMLAIEPRDPPALLLLSGVYRHTDRWRGAVVLVDEIRKLESSDGWEIEIEAESDRVRRASEMAESPTSDASAEPSAGAAKDAADLTAA